MAPIILASGKRPGRMDSHDGFDGIAEVFRQQASQANVMQQILSRHTNMISENTASIGDLARATQERLHQQDYKIAKLQRSLKKQKARLAEQIIRAESVVREVPVDMTVNRAKSAPAQLEPEAEPLPQPRTQRSTRSVSVTQQRRSVSAQRLAKLKPFGRDGRRLICPMCGTDYSREYVLKHMDTVCHN